MSSFSYSVAIKLTVANLASQGVRMLARDLLAAHGNAVALGDKLKALKMTAVGFGMEHAGKGILGFMEKSVSASRDYVHQIALMNSAGFTHREIAGSIASAWATSRSVITTTAAENLAAIRELRSAFGDGVGMQHAYAVLPTVQRAQAIMQSFTGKEQEGVAFDMVKAIEFATKGAITVPSLVRQSEMMTNALTAFQGTLTVSDFHQTLKASKAAAPYLSDDFKYTILPTLMQEMKSGHGGAQAAGTALATMFGTIKGHAIMTRMIPAWMAAGLIAPGGVVADAHHKGMSRVGPGGIVGESMFTDNPFAWAQQVLAPAIARLKAKDHLDDIGAYYALTGNRNTAFMMQTLVNKAVQIRRDQGLIKDVGSSYDVYQRLLKRDPQLAEQAMHNQWQNILAIIGFQILPKLVPFMVRFADALGSISQMMERHPGLTSAATWGGIAAGAGLVVGGKALMTAGIMKFLGITPTAVVGAGRSALGGVAGAAGPLLAALGNGIMILGRALFMNPIGLVVLGIAAAAYVLYRNWNTVGPYVMKTWSIIKAVFHVSMHAIAGQARAMWATVGPYVMKAWSIMSALGGVVGRVFGGIANAVIGALSKLASWVANSWIGKAIGYAAGNIGHALSNGFNSAYTWSQGVNAQYTGGGFVPPAKSQTTQIHTTIKLHGRTLATAVTNHQVQGMQGPRQGTTRVDPSRSFVAQSHVAQ